MTACWPCNAKKSDLTLEQLGWTLLPITDESWDGLAGYYPGLWKAAGEPDPQLHLSWMAAVGVKPSADAGTGRP